MVDKTSSNNQEKLTSSIKGALVKAVNSGDYLTITKAGKDYNVFLASVSAPKMGSASRSEEPFGFEAREFLRDKIIGRKCDFHPEYNFGGREYGSLIVDSENMGITIVKAGLAKVVEKKGALPASSHYEALTEAQNEAKNKKIGLHASTDPKFLEKHNREVTYFGEPGYNAAKLYEEAKSIAKPLEAIVEYVFNASFLTVYIHKFHTVAKISMVHIFSPQQGVDKNFIAEGKTFTEKLLLHRTVGIKLDRFEAGTEGSQGNLYARIYHPAGDIAYEVLKNGFAKLNTPKNTDFDAEYFKTLKEAQLIAQSKQVRIWKDFKPAEEKKQQKPSTSDFMGRVIEVHSGDSLSVERDNDFKQFRIYLATVKAPVLQKKPGEEPDPWAWDSKEALRKALIGKKVRVIMEFSKTVKLQGEQGGEKNMDFATVFLDKNEKNVSCQLLEKGLLRTNVSKSGDNASKYIEDLLAAEKKAVEGKIGVYSASPAPIRVFNDLVANTKKSKDFEAMIMKRPNRKINGVIEYCFSGMRFKVRLDGENTAIALNLLGVKTMANDKNQPKLLELSNDALQFAKDTLFQRDVVVDLEFADKRGTFFGTVSLKNTKEDFGLMLVQNGLAEISIFGNKAPENIEQLELAEEQAKVEGSGIWQKGLKLGASSLAVKEVSQNERLQVLMTDISDASCFYLRTVIDTQYPKIEAELKKFEPSLSEDLEKPIKKGTICAARFSDDNNWYRAKVLNSLGKGEVEVQFIDFGNTDVVNSNSGDLKRLPEKLLQFEPQAKPATLAYLKIPKVTSDLGEQAAKLVQDNALNIVTDVVVVDQFSDGTLQVILFPTKGEKDWNKSVNFKLLSKALAQISSEEDLPSEITSWYDVQENAREEQIGVWQYGGAGDESD